MDKYSDMEAINCNVGIGKRQETVLLGLIKSDGCLLDGMHKVVYYDPKYDLWCLYDSSNGNIITSECYYMKSDGRVIIDHADVRRFINGYATIRSYADKDLEVVGNRGIRRLRIYDSEGNVVGNTFWAKTEFISWWESKGIMATYKCWCFPTDSERQMKNPKCRECIMDIYKDGNFDIHDEEEVNFNDHIKEFDRFVS